MNLSVRERLKVLRVLPKEEDYLNLRLALSFTDEEVEALNIVLDPETEQMSWVGDKIADIPTNEEDTALIADILKKASREKNLTPEDMNVAEMIKCPLCNCPVRIVRREDGSADHYEAVEDFHQFPNPISPVLADFLRASRRGKKTVAIVGSSWTSGPWAPWGEAEVWGMNDLHGLPWYEVEGISRWFQMHDKDSFAIKRKHNHWEWLQEKHPFPIYMLQKFDDVPDSVPYPLREIQKELIGNFYRGEEKMEKLFSSTMCYQMALALHEDVERIEIYGIELVGEGRYAYQREGMAFWMGKADGMGVEVWLPEACALLDVPLYGYETKVGEH